MRLAFDGRLRSANLVPFLLRLILIVMPLDGVDHARPHHEDLCWQKDYREPI